MVKARVNRKLAAIVAIDMVGYGRLIGIDEEGTIARQKAQRAELIDPKVAEYGGRIVKTTGDGLLIEFASVVDAVQCAIEIQEGVADHETDKTEMRRIRYRMGVNLGDVVVDGDDILGDGVNLAARLEQNAEPGGVWVSDDAYRQAVGKVNADFLDLGERQFKNIAKPVRAWAWTLADSFDAPAGFVSAPTAKWSVRPSIAVLPFKNFSNDPAREFFADGITEDIITELSRYHSLVVIARHSSFSYKDRSVNAQTAAADLGVRYILEGSVRRAGERVRITAQLVDAETGAHVWAERYDRSLDDVFSVQDEVSRSVVATLPGRLEATDLNKSERKASSSLDAYECLLQGRQHHLRITPADNVEAIELLNRAISLDPAYADAHALKACAVGQAWRNEFRERTDKLLRECVDGAQQALNLDGDNTEAHRIMCRVRLIQREFDASEYHLQKALTLNPNEPRLVAQRGINLTWLGLPDDGADWLRQALRLDPYQADAYSFDLAHALFVGRHYAEAMKILKQASDPPFDHHADMAACAAHMEALDLAKSAAAHVLEAKPDFTVQGYLEVLPYKHESDRDHHREGLYKAGLPG
jgi:adenylate cyclase